MVTLAELIRRALIQHGSRVAVVDDTRQLTFNDLRSRVARLANALQALASPGARVAVLLGNRLEFVEVDAALVVAGMVKAPINPRLVDREREFVLGNVDAQILITTAAELSAMEDLVARSTVRHVLVVDGERDHDRYLPYEDALAQAVATWPGSTADPAAPSMILHTSGTTGTPKGATTSAENRLAALTSMLVDEHCCGPSDGMVHVAPVEHGSGSKILTFLVRGGRNILLPKFEPEQFFSVAAKYGGTCTFMVPTMIRMLLDALPDWDRQLPTLRNVTYGGSPIPQATLDEALEAFGPIFTQVYGSCEAPHPITTLAKDAHLPDAGPEPSRRLSSAGTVTMSAQAKVVDDRLATLGTGERGELLVTAPSLMMGYWNDEKATGETIVDGWLRTGDIAEIDDAGYVYIVDRKKDMIITGGLNVYPAEVEGVLQTHPMVATVCVVGLPHEKWGEQVTAVVTPSARARGMREDEVGRALDDYSRPLLAGYKRPGRYVLTDSLPVGSTGKVDRRRLCADLG